MHTDLYVQLQVLTGYFFGAGFLQTKFNLHLLLGFTAQNISVRKRELIVLRKSHENKPFGIGEPAPCLSSVDEDWASFISELFSSVDKASCAAVHFPADSCIDEYLNM